MSVEAVESALIHRFRVGHLDLVPKHGIQAVLEAITDKAFAVGRVEEIGSSDISCWMQDVIERLERNRAKR